MASKQQPKLVDVRKIGRKGGTARAANMTPEQRAEAARKAAAARWGNRKERGKKKAKTAK